MSQNTPLKQADSRSSRHLFHFDTWRAADFERIWQRASSFEAKSAMASRVVQEKILVQMFLEPSTRTRCSFEMAGHRLGLRVLSIEGAQSLSLEKGETLEDTFRTLASMQPDALVIRAGDNIDLKTLSEEVDFPVLCAGWGKACHPTQALLDGFVIQKKQANPKNWRILFIGDLRHSRVFASHLQMAQALGYQVGVLAPQSFLSDDPAFKTTAKVFSNLAEGLAWAEFVYTLRFQFERHGTLSFDKDQYLRNYQLRQIHFQGLSKDLFLMHPGPINWGIELHQELEPLVSRVFSQSSAAHGRSGLSNHAKFSLVAEQVASGVWVRQAVLDWALNAELQEVR